MKPEVEFFIEEMNDVEYLNIGLKWEDADGEQVQAVLGAIKGDISQDAMVVIKGLVEQACIYTLGINVDF